MQPTGDSNLDSSCSVDQRISRPALATQRAIADYLDRETARIDALHCSEAADGGAAGGA